MKKRGLTWNEKINAYLRRREIRQARKHEAWLASVQPRMLAATWQGGSYTTIGAPGGFIFVDSPTLIQAVTLSAQGIIVFINIPQGFTHLLLTASARSSVIALTDTLTVNFNSDTSASYDSELKEERGIATIPPVESLAQTAAQIGNVSGLMSPASEFAAFDILIPYYRVSGFNRRWNAVGVVTTNYATQGVRVMNSTGGWRNNSPITQIQIGVSNISGMDVGSRVNLYGVY